MKIFAPAMNVNAVSEHKKVPVYSDGNDEKTKKRSREESRSENVIKDEYLSKLDIKVERIFSDKNKSKNIVNDNLSKEFDKLKKDRYNYIKSNPSKFRNEIVSNEQKKNGLKNMPRDGSYNGVSYIADWENYGDIFVHKNGLSSDKSIVRHAGIGDFDSGWTIESYPSDGVRFRNQFKIYRERLFKKGDGVHLIVNGASFEQYRNATRYAYSKIGRQYNWTFSSAGAGFYCSELVAYSWDAQGIDVNWGVGLDYIAPIYLYWSNNTYVVNH